MSTMKAIKRRIGSVKNMQQIMKAMNLVAASKLQKAKAKMDATRPMHDNFKQIINGIKSCGQDVYNVYVEEREVKNIGYVVITSDRGLCGPYNANVSKEAMAFINANAEKGVKIFAIGAKGHDYFKRRGKNIVYRHKGGSANVTFDDAAEVGDLIVSMYLKGEIDEVYVVYTHFISMLTNITYIDRVLPLSDTVAKQDKRYKLMEYDPEIDGFINDVVPMYIKMFLYASLIESGVCEHVSRMTSMDAAARNAEEIHDDLKLEYNRMRQGAITQEIIEIVSGASALN